MGEARGEGAGCVPGTAADIKQRVEPAASRDVPVDDSFIQKRVVVRTSSGISFALFLFIGAERLFRREVNGSGTGRGHDQHLFSRSESK